jgi:uncharacterized ferritin-like protein (DUF455 family)
MNFYALLEAAITSSEMALKEEYTEQCLAYCTKNRIEERESFVPKNFERPSYAGICRIVDPRALPSRKDFGTPQGLATLAHAVAHIEYSAIDLALDAVYRYPFMPLDYKCDWLEVAADEVRHFKMLEGLLVDLGYSYGDFPVHSGLFDASVHTAGDILDRMAVIPRYYEASGLDVNPQIVKKLHNRRKDPNVARLIEMLEIIYDEEIVHVQKGDKWFRFLCAERGLEAESYYMKILDAYTLTGKHRPHINVEARKEAGFTCGELLKLGADECQ